MLLNTGRALDIELIGEDIGSGNWELFGFMDNVEYLWGSTGEYAGSIGRRHDGRYFAAKDDRYQKEFTYDDKFVCVWYR